MAKQLLYTDDARKKLLSGAEKLARAVGITLGPTGRNVIIDKSFGGPTVTKDGVTVSKEIDLADPFEKVGKDGVITVEEGKTSETTLEFVEGMQFDKGYISPYFGVGNPELKWELENVLILLYEKKLANVREMLPLLEKAAQARRPLLIVAEDVESEALAMLVVNRLRGLLEVCAVKAPGFGDRRKALMGDIATLTGGTFVSEDRGIALDSMSEPSQQEAARGARPEPKVFALLGRADQVVVAKENAT